MRCAIYTRVSTEEQARGGVSLDMQEDRCRQAALAAGAEAVELFCDEGYSAKDMNGPAFGSCLLCRVRLSRSLWAATWHTGGSKDRRREYPGMKPVKPPPLLPCLNTSDLGHGLVEADFRAIFGYLYVDAHWYIRPPGEDTLKVTFLPRHFDHAFFKEPERGQPRTVWKPDRAERLLWIGYTLENPVEVYRVESSRYKLFCRMADRTAPWYLVVIEQMGDWVANFVTAYHLGHRDVVGSRKIGVLLQE